MEWPGVPVAWVWTEMRPRSRHYLVVAARRAPTAAEESRLPDWGKHARVTYCYNAQESREEVASRVRNLRASGMIAETRERK